MKSSTKKILVERIKTLTPYDLRHLVLSEIYSKRETASIANQLDEIELSDLIEDVIDSLKALTPEKLMQNPGHVKRLKDLAGINRSVSASPDKRRLTKLTEAGRHNRKKKIQRQKLQERVGSGYSRRFIK